MWPRLKFKRVITSTSNWLILIALLSHLADNNRVNSAKNVSMLNVNVSSNDSKSNRNATLQLVHVLFRHGPRTPVTTYPNDPYINDTFYPYGWGHLTNDAKRELFKIGSWLGQRYQRLLVPYYKDELIYAQSSFSPRTLMSMSMVLAGMLPPANTPMEWNFQLNWQPIPVFMEPEETDIWLRMKAKCPRYDQAVEEVLQLPHIQEELAEYSEMFEELTEITGLNITTAADITSLYITLLAEQSYGVDLPEWTEDYFPERMQLMAEQSYVYNAYTKEMQRIKGGPFLQKIFQQMQLKVMGGLKPPERKMFLYCAHDWSITNILSALNVWKRQMPRFSALIAFELYEDNLSKENYVEIYFQNEPQQEPEPLTVPGCPFQCPLKLLIELTKDVMPNGTYDEMCKLKD